jgi:hypothetical protein
LKPIEAASSVIFTPVTGSIGSMPLIFVLRFGFDAILAAIGLSGVVGDPDAVVVVDVDVDPVCLDVDPELDAVVVAVDVGLPVVDFAALPVVAGLPLVCVVVVTGLPVVAGLPLVCVVVVTGLPVVVGLPVVCVVVATGLPVLVGLPVLCVVVVTGLPLLAGLADELCP